MLNNAIKSYQIHAIAIITIIIIIDIVMATTTIEGDRGALGIKSNKWLEENKTPSSLTVNGCEDARLQLFLAALSR